MSGARVEVTETGIRIKDLEIDRPTLGEFFRSVADDERDEVFIRAVEVGVLCLERARTSQDTEFVRRQVEALLTNVERSVGAIPGKVQEELVGKIGTGEGQVLAPIERAVGEAQRATKERLDEVKQLLSEEIDPRKESSTLGQALATLRNLLDPARGDSVQATFAAAIYGVIKQDGPLAQAVKAVVASVVEPLTAEVRDLAREVRGERATAEAKPTEKGSSFEDEVLGALENWKRITGALVKHVGGDNQPGDIVIELPATSLAAVAARVVIEARDRQDPAGHKRISDDLKDAMAERQADAAIYLSRTHEGLAKEIGEWTDGRLERGPFVATIHGHLITAIRFLIGLKQLEALRAARPELDAGAVFAQVRRVRTALQHITNIKTKVSDLMGGAEEIGKEADALREDVRNALDAIEEAVKAGLNQVREPASAVTTEPEAKPPSEVRKAFD